MRHRIVLYNPPAVFWIMPLALLAVGSALDRTRYEVEIVDGRFEPVEALLDRLEGALCLGVTVLTGAPLGGALAVSRAARRRFPALPVIWGGWHPSLFAAACVAEPAVSAAVAGQGEAGFAAIADRLAAGAALDGIAGCWTIPDEVPPPAVLEDVNSFPPHDYELIDPERYFAAKQRRQLDMITSQGCRFRCSFCADPAVFKRGWSGLEPERVVATATSLWRRWQFDDLAFQDETFFTSQGRVTAIADGMLRAGTRYTWSATLRADQGRRMDEAAFALCRASGLRDVVLGLESGHPATLRAIRKDITLDDVWDAADKLRRHGIGAHVGVIVGFPDEPRESVLSSLDTARRLRELSPDFRVSVFAYKPYPGNPIAARLLAGGYRFPATLEEWADFDYVGGRSQWLADDLQRLVDGFRFYQRVGWDRGSPLLGLRRLARWRVRRHAYRWPLERRLARALGPAPELS